MMVSLPFFKYVRTLRATLGYSGLRALWAERRTFFFVFSIACLVHVMNLSGHEFAHWDESIYLMISEFVRLGRSLYQDLDVINHGPLVFHLLSLFCTGNLAHDLMVARYLAVIFRVSSILLVYIIACRLTDKEWKRTLTMGLFAFSTIGVTLGRVFMPDDFEVFFLLASIYFLVSNIQSKDWKKLVFSGLFAGLALVSKETALFYILPVFVFLCYRRIKDGAVFLSSMALTGLAVMAPFLIRSFDGVIYAILAVNTCRPYTGFSTWWGWWWPISFDFTFALSIVSLLAYFILKKREEHTLLAWAFGAGMTFQFLLSFGMYYQNFYQWIAIGVLLITKIFDLGETLKLGRPDNSIDYRKIIIVLFLFAVISGQLYTGTFEWAGKYFANTQYMYQQTFYGNNAAPSVIREMREALHPYIQSGCKVMALDPWWIPALNLSLNELHATAINPYYAYISWNIQTIANLTGLNPYGDITVWKYIANSGLIKNKEGLWDPWLNHLGKDIRPDIVILSTPHETIMKNYFSDFTMVYLANVTMRTQETVTGVYDQRPVILVRSDLLSQS